MITRRRSEGDRRQVIVALTETGRSAVAAKRALWEQTWRDALAEHSDEELQAAARVMRTVAGLLDGLGRQVGSTPRPCGRSHGRAQDPRLR